MTHRLFVAIRPPAPIRDMLIDTMEGLEGARWQDEDQLHLTLRFVGDCDARQGDDLAAALASVRVPPFPLALARVGHFERRGRPHTLWAGLTDSDPLRLLSGKVEQACRRAGIAAETRRFAPHVTIARLNAGTAPLGPWVARHGDLAGPAWTVDAFALYESHLGTAGAFYETVMRYSLIR